MGHGCGSGRERKRQTREKPSGDSCWRARSLKDQELGLTGGGADAVLSPLSGVLRFIAADQGAVVGPTHDLLVAATAGRSKRGESNSMGAHCCLCNAGARCRALRKAEGASEGAVNRPVKRRWAPESESVN